MHSSKKRHKIKKKKLQNFLYLENKGSNIWHLNVDLWTNFFNHTFGAWLYQAGSNPTSPYIVNFESWLYNLTSVLALGLLLVSSEVDLMILEAQDHQG